MRSSDSIIVRDPQILGGTPVFHGTRVPFQSLLDYVEGGETLDEFLDDFPTVTRKAAVDALEYVKKLVADDIRFTEAINTGLEAANRGEFVEQEEVRKKLKHILLP